jgi:hypothetical protein
MGVIRVWSAICTSVVRGEFQTAGDDSFPYRCLESFLLVQIIYVSKLFTLVSAVVSLFQSLQTSARWRPDSVGI